MGHRGGNGGMGGIVGHRGKGEEDVVGVLVAMDLLR